MKADALERILKILSFLFLTVLVGFFVSINILPDRLAHLPEQSWTLKPSDTIIVLGTPAKKDGQAGPVMRMRVKKAVDLLNQGYGKQIIFSGAAAHNRFVEAKVMAEYAQSLGVAPERIVLEPEAENTYQNAFDSVALMRNHGWKSAVVVTSMAHTRRSNYIFSHYPVTYCVVGCEDPPEQSTFDRVKFDQREKFHLLAALLSGQSVSFGLKPEQAQALLEWNNAGPR